MGRPTAKVNVARDGDTFLDVDVISSMRRPNAAGEFPRAFFTIGHSTRTVENVVDLLQEAGADYVVDVRKFPRSRRYPQFNVEVLPANLGAYGIGYSHLALLGGRRGSRPREEPSLNDGWRNRSFRNYADYALTPAFEEGMSQLISLGRTNACALMCAEAVWWRCHRRIIADHLLARGARVFHILGKGQIHVATLTPGALIEGGAPLYPA